MLKRSSLKRSYQLGGPGPVENVHAPGGKPSGTAPGQPGAGGSAPIRRLQSPVRLCRSRPQEYTRTTVTYRVKRRKAQDNPEFIDDMIGTVANSVARMQRLMEQMRTGIRTGGAESADGSCLKK